MYTHRNFKSKKALKEAVAAGERVTVFQPSGDLTGVSAPENGHVALEGPHYPAPHRWYASATIVNGLVTKVSLIALLALVGSLATAAPVSIVPVPAKPAWTYIGTSATVGPNNVWSVEHR